MQGEVAGVSSLWWRAGGSQKASPLRGVRGASRDAAPRVRQSHQPGSTSTVVLRSDIRCSSSHGNAREAGWWQRRPGKAKAALTPSGRGGEAQSTPASACLFPALCPAGLRAYLGGSCLSWLLRSSLLMTCVMSTVVAASLALASSSCCLRMMGLGLERR